MIEISTSKFPNGSISDSMMESARKKSLVESVIKKAKQENNQLKVENDSLKDENFRSSANEEEQKSNESSKPIPRSTYSSQKKRDILDCHMQYGETYTRIKYGISEGTLKNLITNYNKFGDEIFEDKRKKMKEHLIQS